MSKKKIIISILSALLLTGCGDTDFVIPVTPPVVHEATVEEHVITIDSTVVDDSIFHSKGINEVKFEIDDIEFEGHLVVPTEDAESIFYLEADFDQFHDCDACVYNTDAINGITDIEITYTCADEITVLYGDDRGNLEYSVNLPSQSVYLPQEVILAEASSYFRIISDYEDMYVSSIEISCNGQSEDHTTIQSVEGYRYIPEVNYNPKEGDTLKIPVCDIDEEGNITINEWKEYTYHSYEYCVDRIKNYGDDPGEYALTDMVDVSNYFILFNKIPPNFGVIQQEKGIGLLTEMAIGHVEPYNDVCSYFGQELTRCVSQYTRIDGYTKDMPLKLYKDTGAPMYYEFDIELVEYNPNVSGGRGIGRLVGIVGGFEGHEDGINTVLKTTDHYYSFAEYSNMGFFNESYDGDSHGLTSKRWKLSKVVDLPQ